MTACIGAALKILVPFVIAELVVLGVQWFVLPEDSWVTYALFALSAVVLPLIAAARLALASFPRWACVASGLTFTLINLAWAASVVISGFGGANWQAFTGFVIASLIFAIPPQLFSAYLGARYAKSFTKAAT